MENWVFSPLSAHVNQVILILGDFCLTPGNFILTIENLGPRVNDSLDSGSRENPALRSYMQMDIKSIIVLQECSFDTGLQNSCTKKNDPSKNMAFMGDSFSCNGIY